MSTRPKRRKKSAAARLRPFWIVIVLIGIASGFAGYYAATWPGFYPKRVSVSGNRIVPTAEILSRAEIAPYENIWLQSMGKAARRIAAAPYVKTVTIHRTLPAGVHIIVAERAPFAILKTGSGRAVVDRDLRVLQPLEHESTLPVLVTRLAEVPRDGTFVKDADAVRLRDDYDALAAAHVAVRSLHYDKFGDLVAGTRGGISLLLGDDTDLQKKTPLIDPIISQVSASGKKLAAVDLRAPKTPVVVYKR
jgi:cell division septal protein FtsQ